METQATVRSTVRESTAADKEEVFKLREAVYGEPFGQEEWHWKFEKHSGIPAKVYVAEVNGSIVGLRAFIIERLKILDKIWATGLGVEIMVHPDFRRYGIASQVANEAFSQMEDAGMPILIGFPNESAFQVYSRRRSNWRHVCSIPLLVKPLKFDSILLKYIKNPLLRALMTVPTQLSGSILFRFRGNVHAPEDFTVSRAEAFDERFDVLWEEVHQQYGISLVRDSAFLRWRFTEKPATGYVTFVAEQKGKLLGYIVLRKVEMFDLKTGVIIDILTVNQNNNVATSLLLEAIKYFKECGQDAVACLMLKHAPYFKTLKRAGFVIAPKRVIQREFYFGVQLKPSIVPNEIINRQENWFITFADTDLF